MMQNDIDTPSYNEGRAAFNAGVSIRQIVEAFAKADTDVSEAKAMSGALGFLDAAFDKLRGITR